MRYNSHTHSENVVANGRIHSGVGIGNGVFHNYLDV